MTVDGWFQNAQETLNAASINTARLDALVLLEDCLGRDRALLLAHPETELSAEQVKQLDNSIKRRAEHMPLAYIRGKTEFYGREFVVSEAVLQPRPESETMIELLLKLLRSADNMTLVDVGTGSGALAITAKLELPKTTVIAIDIDTACLEIARQNAKRLKAGITFLEGDMLLPISDEPPQKYALLCNLPYVPENFHINQAATYEPKIALFGGPDGLNPYRKLFKEIDQLFRKPVYVLTEALPPQQEQLLEIAFIHGYIQHASEDFIQVFTPKS